MLARGDGTLLHCRMFAQRHFDFIQLDTISSDLNLAVDPSGKNDVAIRKVSETRPCR